VNNFFFFAKIFIEILTEICEHIPTFSGSRGKYGRCIARFFMPLARDGQTSFLEASILNKT
jgi:hypothetical protein